MHDPNEVREITCLECYEKRPIRRGGPAICDECRKKAFDAEEEKLREKSKSRSHGKTSHLPLDHRLYLAYQNGVGLRLTADDVDELVVMDDAILTRMINVIEDGLSEAKNPEAYKKKYWKIFREDEGSVL